MQELCEPWDPVFSFEKRCRLSIRWLKKKPKMLDVGHNDSDPESGADEEAPAALEEEVEAKEQFQMVTVKEEEDPKCAGDENMGNKRPLKKPKRSKEYGEQFLASGFRSKYGLNQGDDAIEVAYEKIVNTKVARISRS